MTKRFNDITGRRFNRWTVIRYDKTIGRRHYFIAKCACGKEKSVFGSSLTTGVSKSCGCLRVEIVRNRSLTHGEAIGRRLTKEFRAWRGMKNRCYDKRCKSYKDYGGRGIIVCKRWLRSFQNFLKDMGRAPTKAHSIDRTDNDGNYSPENCRWATYSVQANNKSTNRILEYRGQKKTMAQWAKSLNMNYHLIYDRIAAGWSIEKTLGGQTILEQLEK